MPTRIPLVNGIRSSCAAAIVRQTRGRVLGRRPLVGDEVGVDRLEHQPLRSGHLAQARQVRPAQHAEVGVRQQPALERPLARPHHVGREVIEAELGQPSPDTGVVVGASPVSTSSSLTWRRAARSISRSTSSGS